MIPIDAQGEGRGRGIPRGSALLFAALSALAGLAAMGALPGALLAPCAAPVVLLGAGLPILLPWLRAEPCPLKIAVLAALLSPPLFGAIHLLLRIALSPDPALAATFGAILLLQPLALLRRDRLARPGRAAWIALGAGLACAALVGLLLLSGNVVRLDGELFGRCALALAIDRGVPPTSPLLAGAAWTEPWLYEGVAVGLMRALRSSPSEAFALLNAWAALLLPLLLFLLAACLWRDGRRGLLAIPLGVLGGSALGGLAWLARGFESSPVRGLDELARALEPGRPIAGVGLDPALDGLATIGPGAIAMVVLVGAWLCAAHALARTGPGWAGTCGILHAVALLIEPGPALASLLAAAAAALLLPGRAEARPRLLLALASTGIPALLLLRGMLGDTLGMERTWDPSLALPAVASATLLAIAAGLALVGPSRDQEPADERAGRRSVLLLLLLAALMGAALPAILPDLSGPMPSSLPPLALGVLAAGGLVDALGAGGARRAGAAALALSLVLGIGAHAYGSLRARLALARESWPLIEEPLAILPAEVPGEVEEARDLRRTMEWLRRELPFRDRDPVLLVNPRPAGEEVFRERVGFHPAAVFAALDLWSEADPKRAGGERRQPRWSAMEAIYRDERDFDPGLMIELDRLGRPGIAMVCRADRRDRPWLEYKFGPRGFRVLKVIGSVALFAWPAEVVASVPEAERAFPEHHFPRRDREPVYGREEKR